MPRPITEEAKQYAWELLQWARAGQNAGFSIHFVNIRHEQIAAHAADGYARAKNETVVVLSHLGPGMTNAATGVANAALDCIQGTTNTRA